MVEIHNAREYVAEGDIVKFSFDGDEKSTVVKIIRVRGNEVLQRELSPIERIGTVWESVKDCYSRYPEMVPVTFGVIASVSAIVHFIIS
jgi:hypothetical protein